MTSIRAVELRGPDIISAQVRKFIEYIESCLRSGTYNPAMFTNLIDPPAMEASFPHVPTARWQTDWDVDRILDALRVSSTARSDGRTEAL